MANSTAGQMILSPQRLAASPVSGGMFGRVIPLDSVNVLMWPHLAAAPLSGAQPNKMFRMSDFPAIVGGQWMVWQVATPITAQPSRVIWYGGGARNSAPVAPTGVTEQWAGAYKLEGQTVLNGLPFPALVLVYPDTAPSLCVRSMQTGADGLFTFTGLAPGRYTVIGIDINRALNGRIWALVDAVPM